MGSQVAAPVEPAGLATATVGLLFSDIEGSTRLLQHLGPAYPTVLLEHHALLRAAFAAHGGKEISTEGDSFFVTFPSASDAVAAALDGQLALAAHEWPAEGAVRVRMGVHVGEIQTVAGTVVGMAVHEAARIGAAANGAQVLASARATELCRPIAGVGWQDLGRHELKDIGAPVQLLQLTHPGLPRQSAPPRTQASGRNNLPAQVSAFIGRKPEIEELDELIGAARLVTITGAGGAGKSKIALRIAADQGARFPDGVWLVELAPITEPEDITRQVLGAIGVRDTGVTDIGAAIGRRRLLLIVDNCEHLTDAVRGLVDRILRQCAGLSVLATSREPLGLVGEISWRLPPLTEADAFELFATRARAASRTFTVTDANKEAIKNVCRKLDGIPLALELAAGRLGALSLEQMATRLDARFRLLAGGGHGSARQRTLQATVDWSYDLLDPTAQSTLRRLGVFVGGFTLEAAEALCSGPDLDADDVLDVIDQLVAKSLVVAEERDGAVRFRLLETIRHYALDRLADRDELEAARAQQLTWARQLLLDAEPAIMLGGSEAEWLARLDDEADNVHSALDWALDRGDLSTAAIMLIGLFGWFLARGRLQEGLDWSQRVGRHDLRDGDRALVSFVEFVLTNNLSLMDTDRLERFWRDTRALADSERRWLAAPADAYLAISAYWTAGKPIDQALSACRRAVDAARGSNNTARAMTLQALSWAQLEEGDLRAARAAAVEAVALARKAGLSINESRLSLSIAMVDLAAGDYDRAWEHAQDAVDAARRTGDRHLLILGTSRLAEVAARRSELGRARDLLLSVLDHVVELQTDDGLGEFYDTLAALSLLDGDTDAASTFSARALGLATPGSVAEARVLGTAGAIATARAEPALATERYLAAARHLAQHGDGPSPFATTGQPVLASVAEGLAAVRVGVGDFDGAALLLGVAEGCKMAPDTVARPSTGGWSVRRLPAELRRARSVMDATRASLGDERFQERLAAGRELSLADAVAAAAAMPITAMFAPPVEGD